MINRTGPVGMVLGEGGETVGLTKRFEIWGQIQHLPYTQTVSEALTNLISVAAILTAALFQAEK